MWNKDYSDSLRLLNTYSLEYRRIYTDLVLCFELLSNGFNWQLVNALIKSTDNRTRDSNILYPPSKRSEIGGDYVFTFVCVCLCVCLCALNPVGLNGQNDVLYSTRTWKVENVSVRTIYRWKRRFIGFLKVEDRSWGWGEMYKNVTPFLMDFLHMPQHAVQQWRHYRWQASTVHVHY